MKTLSMDLRKRILAAYDKGQGTRDDIANRFCVSLGMVKKLIQQRRHTGNIAPRYDRCGRKPMLLAEHRKSAKSLLQNKPDLTLEELRKELQVPCSLVAIHYMLQDMGLTYKKRHSAPANKTAKTWRGRAATGAANKGASNPKGLSS
jgi:transposase